jgi:hypothetical protein
MGLPWLERACVLHSAQRSWVESIVKAAVECSDAAGGIVEEVMDERHLVSDR